MTGFSIFVPKQTSQAQWDVLTQVPVRITIQEVDSVRDKSMSLKARQMPKYCTELDNTPRKIIQPRELIMAAVICYEVNSLNSEFKTHIYLASCWMTACRDAAKVVPSSTQSLSALE